MPKIREYAQQLSAVTRPLSQAADPGMAARQGDAKKSIGGALMQLGDNLFDIAEHNDATTMQVELANARAEYTQKMQRAKETGEAADPEYVQSVQNEAQERAAAIADKMTTRRGADAAKTYGAQFASGMQTMAISDNAAAIGEQAKLRAMESQNINRNTLRSSPDQFQAILGETLNTLDGPAYAHIDAGVREEMKMQAKSGLALATVEGVIHTRSPEEARQILDSGQLDGILTADHKRGLYAEADQAIRAREAEAARLERQQKLLEEKEHQRIGAEFVAKMNTPNGNQLSTKEVLASTLPWQMKEHFIKEMTEGPAKTDNALVNRLFLDMYREEGDPKKITSPAQLLPYVNRIGLTAWDHLNKELDRAPASKEVGRAASTARMAFRGSKVGAALPDVAELAFLDWRNDLRATTEQYRAEGKDPSVLISRDPNNKESFLNPNKMSQYLKPTNLLTSEQAMAVEGSKGNPAANVKKLPFKEFYDALPSGAHYIDPDGKPKVKR